MMSITRQCNEAMKLLEQLQACVERVQPGEYSSGAVIPARLEDFQAYITRARALVGVVECRRRTYWKVTKR